MRKFKLNAGKIQVKRLIDGEWSEGTVVQTPPMFIMAADVKTFSYIVESIPLSSFTLQEDFEPIKITQPNLN